MDGSRSGFGKLKSLRSIQPSRTRFCVLDLNAAAGCRHNQDRPTNQAGLRPDSSVSKVDCGTTSATTFGASQPGKRQILHGLVLCRVSLKRVIFFWVSAQIQLRGFNGRALRADLCFAAVVDVHRTAKRALPSVLSGPNTAQAAAGRKTTPTTNISAHAEPVQPCTAAVLDFAFGTASALAGCAALPSPFLTLYYVTREARVACRMSMNLQRSRLVACYAGLGRSPTRRQRRSSTRFARSSLPSPSARSHVVTAWTKPR